MRFVNAVFFLMPVLAMGECMDNLGATNCGPGEVPLLRAVGVVTTNQTTVKGESFIQGKLYANKTSFQDIHIDGSARVENSQIQHLMTINGFLIADQSQFQNIEISSNQMVLKGSSVQQIRFRSSGAHSEITLENGTQVQGDIYFEGNAGTVYLNGGSTIHGSVVNGEVKKR